MRHPLFVRISFSLIIGAWCVLGSNAWAGEIRNATLYESAEGSFTPKGALDRDEALDAIRRSIALDSVAKVKRRCESLGGELKRTPVASSDPLLFLGEDLGAALSFNRTSGNWDYQMVFLFSCLIPDQDVRVSEEMVRPQEPESPPPPEYYPSYPQYENPPAYEPPPAPEAPAEAWPPPVEFHHGEGVSAQNAS